MTDLAVLFCTPMYGGMVTTAHFNSCMNLRRVLDQVGLSNDWVTGTRESLITRARNEMTATFLSETEYSHQCWLDSDIEFTPEDFNAIWNMCEGPLQADIAVGVYAMKVPDKQWYAAWKDGKLIKDLDQFDGPVEVDYAGTGFMLIKRKVVETLAEKVGSYEIREGKRAPCMYMTPIHNGCFESEDYHFCRIARESGFSLWMDPSVRLGHIGQYTYGDSGISRDLRGEVSTAALPIAV